MTHITVVGVAFLLVSATLRSADIPYTIIEQSGNPVKLATSAGEQSGVNYLDLIPANIGNKEIVGYVLVVKHYDEAGRTLTNLFERKRLATATDAPFSPGKAWGVHRVFIAPTVVQSEVSIDYVLFADETDWGPDVLKRGSALKAFIAGTESAASA